MEKGIKFCSDSLRNELWMLAKGSQAGYANYVCDSLAEEAGHSVLRLPPYHFELNPIEVVWAQGKEG